MGPDEAAAAETRAGGWGAWGVAAAGLARLFALAGLLPAGGSGVRAWTAVLVAAGVAAAAAQALAVEGARRRLAPASRLTWVASGAGWTGAALTAVGALVIGVRSLSLAPAEALRSGLLLGWLAAFATALWVAGVCAADWRALRLPAWLRVVGTLFAVLSLAAAVLPPLGALAVPFALAWWIGLGAALLRPPRSTSG